MMTVQGYYSVLKGVFQSVGAFFVLGTVLILNWKCAYGGILNLWGILNFAVEQFHYVCVPLVTLILIFLSLF